MPRAKTANTGNTPPPPPPPPKISVDLNTMTTGQRDDSNAINRVTKVDRPGK